jgi:hypothetical protein
MHRKKNTYKTIILLFTTLFLCTNVQGQILEKYKSESAIISFDKTEIIDTIYVDSSASEKATYYDFNFINSGTELLIISYTGGQDPCFMSSFPQEPIKPGEKGKISIACPGWSGKSIIERDSIDKKNGFKREYNVKTLSRSWKINSNAKNDVTLMVRQIFVLKK